MELSLDQVVVHHSEYEGAQLLAPWAWLLTEPCSVLLPTVLGHLFLERADGTVWFLDSWAGDLEQVAASYEEFRDWLEGDPDFQERYLLLGFVAELLEAGFQREPGMCFAPFVSPGVGGSLTPANFHPFPMRIHQVTSAAEHLATQGKGEGRR